VEGRKERKKERKKEGKKNKKKDGKKKNEKNFDESEIRTNGRKQVCGVNSLHFDKVKVSLCF
jgi:hypothetical protein